MILVIIIGMDADRWYQLAQVKMGESNYKEAIDLLGNTIKFDENHLLAHQDLALALIHQGLFEEAFNRYVIILSKDDTIATRVKQAGLYLMMDQAEKARLKFEIILDLEPDNKEAKKGLGDCFFRQENYRKALEIYNELITINPDDAFLRFSKAETLYRSQDHEQALTIIDEAIELEQAPEFFAFKGDFFIRHDNYERALEQYRLAANLDPKNPEIRMRIGFILRILDRLNDAIKEFDLAYSLDKSYIEALHNKSELQSALGQHDAARAVREQIIRQYPEDLKTGLSLTCDYMDNGGYLSAGELLELLSDHHSDNPEIWYGLAFCMYQLEEHNRAIQAINKVIELDGQKDDYLSLKSKIELKLANGE